MNSFHLFGSFRPMANLVVKRYLLSPKDRIKLLNFQNKSLYGPIIKKNQSKPKKVTIQNGKVASTSSDVAAKRPETNYASEMHWIINNKWNEIVAQSGLAENPSAWNEIVAGSEPKILDESKVKKVSSLTSKKSAKKVSSNAKENSSEINLEKCEKRIVTEVIDSNTNRPAVVTRPILLSNEELKNILNHPLQTEVLSAPPSNIRVPQFRTVPSVGKILQYTMSETARSALLNWKLTKIKELGEQGFADLQQSNLNSGFKFHWSLEHYFLTKEVPRASSSVHQLWESVRGVLDTFTAMPESVEKSLLHPTLKYKGICDCVAEVNNQLTIIEWKKSGRSKPTLDATYDAPVQLCAYLGAINSIAEYQGRIKQGMVVVAYEDGKQADVYKMNEVMLRQYWRVWLGRLNEFWIRTRDGTLPEPI